MKASTPQQSPPAVYIQTRWVTTDSTYAKNFLNTVCHFTIFRQSYTTGVKVRPLITPKLSIRNIKF